MSGLIKVAKGIYYDNTTSGYVADRVQEAIDENASNIAAIDTWDEIMHNGSLFTILNNENLSATITQNDVTNNPAALIINNTGSGNDITLPNSSYIKNGGMVLSGALHVNEAESALFTTADIQVFQNSSANATLWSASVTASVDADLNLVRSRGTIATPAACQNGDYLGNINFIGETDGSNFNNGAQIRAIVNGVVSVGVLPTDLVFYTNPGGGVAVEAMRLDKDKNLILLETLHIGSHTSILEDTDGTLLYNDNDNIRIKLSDALGVRRIEILDSTNTVVAYIDSDGGIESLIGSDGVYDVKNAASVTKAKINSVGDSYFNGGNTGFGTTTPNALVDIFGSMGWKVRTIALATGTIAVTDNIIAVDYTTTGTVALDLPSAASAWNTDGTGIVFTILDIDANANTNNITISRVGADTIIDSAAAQTSTVIAVDGGVVRFIPINSTTWKVF